MRWLLNLLARFVAPWTTEDSVQTDLALHGYRIERLETRMSATDDALAKLDDATTAVAGRLEALANQVASMDADAAAKINAEADRLRGMASDPDNPVPDQPVEPAPSDGGDTPTDAA